ncbi:hypothetical protein PFLUV_G00208460 [Perca fluviatilis]|uniref:Uncharacterized protein n=1 Tax=Perca fluviatilis TaxID=8168 RepID=A0A6A5EB25_PERFL|nr:hypothetical protein PFLUV_G00208460 [Perca fluviatilis]
MVLSGECPGLPAPPLSSREQSSEFPKPPSALARDTLPVLHSPRPDSLPPALLGSKQPREDQDERAAEIRTT